MHLQPSTCTIGKALYRKKEEEDKKEIAREYKSKIVAGRICESPHQDQAVQAYEPCGDSSGERNKDTPGNRSVAEASAKNLKGPAERTGEKDDRRDRKQDKRENQLGFV
jgi:hypothetical protein